MSILSDRDIRAKIRDKEIIISPFNNDCVQPASVDLHLGHNLLTVNGDLLSRLDGDEYYSINPGEFVLGSTLEHIELPMDVLGFVDGKSSIGRLGLTAHITAGFIDPCFRGNITLEIKNVSDEVVNVGYGMSLCQIIFFTLSSPCEHGYGSPVLDSHYQGSKGTVVSRYKQK